MVADDRQVGGVADVVQEICTGNFGATSTPCRYTDVKRACDATKKGLTGTCRKSFRNNVRLSGFEPPRP